MHSDVDMFRVFDHVTTDVVFWGQRFNLNALVTAAQQLRPRVRMELDKPRERPSTFGHDH